MRVIFTHTSSASVENRTTTLLVAIDRAHTYFTLALAKIASARSGKRRQ
jgi:hypothetical protein